MKLIKKVKRRIKQLNATLDEIGAKGWERFRLTFDIYYCKKILHATDEEYLFYQFYNFKNRYRKQFMLTYHQHNFMRLFNNPGIAYRKSQLHQHIPLFFQRESLLAPECGAEAFLHFVKKHGVIVTKPDVGSYGKCIEKLSYTNDDDVLNYFNNLKRDTLCEELVIQHEKMNQFNASSVNTVRIVSLRKDGEIVIISATLRAAGVKGTFTDNLSQGGIGAQVDIATGVVSTYGADYSGTQYQNHPVTGCRILGFQIPNWDKAIALVKSAHGALIDCDYLGWDIAITPTGADIIEANTACDPVLTQFLDGVPKGTLVLPIIKERLKTLKGANGKAVLSQREYKKIKQNGIKRYKELSQL